MLDYSQPLEVDVSQAESEPAESDPVIAQFDEARARFLESDYQGALAGVDKALALAPKDAVLHEFRALVLFAMKQYTEAAATIHSVLAVGSGWDWATMSGLYPSVDVYTQQLRALEGFRKQHPDSAEATFLLAYHYLTCGHTDAAAAQLKRVMELVPKDELAKELLKMTTSEETEESSDAAEPPAATAPSSEGKPVDPKALAGTWSAERADGANFKLALGEDRKFGWRYQQQDQNSSFSGTYTLADAVLILQSNEGAMVANLSMSGNDAFKFTLVGSSPDDPGLDFRRGN